MPMWDAISGWGGWDEVGAGGVWLMTICLFVMGLVGCIVPVIPGHLVILMGAVAYRWILGPDAGLSWWSVGAISLLLIASQVFEFVSGAAGAKWFGGTKWGAGGAIVGGIVGMFFMPFGLILGPLFGAYLFEAMFAKQEHKPAMVSGVGSAVGTMAGLVVKVMVGLVMIIWFFSDVFFVH
ncbi:DUF456 domain-containing protein [Haloferula chungangensis]|uniref:DUF456 domain-containing protein n=1 Tax=Haloferula chungangensis TaxID=1048331 RepID=A0ABW2L9D8_9BACT